MHLSSSIQYIALLLRKGSKIYKRKNAKIQDVTRKCGYFLLREFSQVVLFTCILESNLTLQSRPEMESIAGLRWDLWSKCRYHHLNAAKPVLNLFPALSVENYTSLPGSL